MASPEESASDSTPQTLPTDNPLLTDISMKQFRSFLGYYPLDSSNGCIPIMVNACTGKMGKAIIEEAESSGLFVVPVSFCSERKSGKIHKVRGQKFFVQGPANRERFLQYLLSVYPDLIVVDFTVSSAVNANAELYCKHGVPFVMGTTGGDRNLLANTIQDSQVYALVSPQMAKQAVAFIGILDIMADRFPMLFSGYSLKAVESLDQSRAEISETAKTAISFFNKLGVPFNIAQIESIRDPTRQPEMVIIGQDHVDCHELHAYNLASPGETARFEFRICIRGRSIYVDGTVEAVFFLARKVGGRDDKRVYDMHDVLKEGYVQ
ncbi:4-hydroxy-tetrahydrodipicolinate reductase 1, chloroplastic-like [Prosopis cineraria]|uniref:4-hydroxy-tetrahydrodipicolinate reductase 1, chloroplastic-like n=1 Tax=Prosopis cineraria TaxID=364024 RepID=UPI00240FA89A|nr:4-hydroxy-tetrahydrodipicolinate reductase 1, chloroplastic-like [Prosopis cineraria]